MGIDSATSFSQHLASWRERARRHSLLLLLLATVGLVSYLSLTSAQKSVDDLADQLMTQVGKRVDQQLSSLLNDIEQINRTNTNLFGSGQLSPAQRQAIRGCQARAAWTCDRGLARKQQQHFFAARGDEAKGGLVR